MLLRLGRRSIGWFELGLGAYDASSTLRPGAFIGGALGSLRDLRISSHLGVHFPNGLCCSTVPLFGWRGEVSVEHAFSDSLTFGAGAAFTGNVVVEGSARLSIAL